MEKLFHTFTRIFAQHFGIKIIIWSASISRIITGECLFFSLFKINLRISIVDVFKQNLKFTFSSSSFGCVHFNFERANVILILSTLSKLKPFFLSYYFFGFRNENCNKTPAKLKLFWFFCIYIWFFGSAAHLVCLVVFSVCVRVQHTPKMIKKKLKHPTRVK